MSSQVWTHSRLPFSGPDSVLKASSGSSYGSVLGYRWLVLIVSFKRYLVSGALPEAKEYEQKMTGKPKNL